MVVRLPHRPTSQIMLLTGLFRSLPRPTALPVLAKLLGKAELEDAIDNAEGDDHEPDAVPLNKQYRFFLEGLPQVVLVYLFNKKFVFKRKVGCEVETTGLETYSVLLLLNWLRISLYRAELFFYPDKLVLRLVLQKYRGRLPRTLTYCYEIPRELAASQAPHVAATPVVPVSTATESPVPEA